MTSEWALRAKLHETAVQLKVLEEQKGWQYMMCSQLNQEFVALLEHYEKIADDRKAG